jgi:hypothetical protein
MVCAESDLRCRSQEIWETWERSSESGNGFGQVIESVSGVDEVRSTSWSVSVAISRRLAVPPVPSNVKPSQPLVFGVGSSGLLGDHLLPWVTSNQLQVVVTSHPRLNKQYPPLGQSSILCTSSPPSPWLGFTPRARETSAADSNGRASWVRDRVHPRRPAFQRAPVPEFLAPALPRTLASIVRG